MTTKEQLHKLVDELSEAEVNETLRIVTARRQGKSVDQWGDLGAQTDAAAADTMRRLDGEERAELGETIGEVWERESRP